MFDVSLPLILLFIGIVLFSRMKTMVRLQKQKSAAEMKMTQRPGTPLKTVKQETAKIERRPVLPVEGRGGSAMSSSLVKSSEQKNARPARYLMTGDVMDNSEGFDKEWAQGMRIKPQVKPSVQIPAQAIPPLFTRDNLIQSFIVHEVLDKPKYRQRLRRG